MAIALAGCIIAHMWLSLGGYYRRAAHASLCREPDSGWRLILKTGACLPVCILPTSVVHPGFVLLHLQTDTWRHDWLILRDSLTAEDFRGLRVALRIRGLSSRSP